MTRSLVRLTCASLASVAALAGPAFADTPDEPRTPMVFPTLGPDALGSRLSVQLGLQTFDGLGERIKRLDLGGQFMSRQSRLGAYASVGLASAGGTESIGNIELGGLFRAGGGRTETALRFGVVAPTASDDDGFLGLVSTASARPSDIVTAVPETTTLRLAVAPTHRSGQAVFRIDAGVDVPIERDGADFDPLFHVDLGVGFDSSSFGVAAELQTVGSLGEGDGTAHVFAVTAQGRTGKLTPYATLSMPFTSEEDDAGAYNLFGGLRIGL